MIITKKKGDSKNEIKKKVVVIYDGIENSVFEGQVLQPLIIQLRTKRWNTITIISFEKNTKNAQIHASRYHDLDIIIFKKIPLLGTISLYYAAYQLKKVLHNLSEYHLSARGPLAGWICFHAIHKTSLPQHITVQARGLLAEEYKFTHAEKKSFPKRWWHRWRTFQLAALEKYTYCTTINHIPIKIEAVSYALKKYLCETYQINENRITVTQNDIPTQCVHEKRIQWRKEIRKELSISSNTHVYCYNGSVKPWQCPEQIIAFFKNKLYKNKNVFLLILTQDKEPFERLIKQSNIPFNTYYICTVKHRYIYRYLSACDTGLIFRKPHIINWISRPTKVLEYRAAGLDIIHNNTIAWLTVENKIALHRKKIMPS